MHPNQIRSRKQEASVAKDFGGRVTPASGAMDGSKDDGRTQRLVRQEVKTTNATWYRFDPRLWIPLRRRALNMCEEPLFQIDLSQGRVRIALAGWDFGVPPSTGIRSLVEVGPVKAYRFNEDEWRERFLVEDCTALKFQIPSLTLYVMPYSVFEERLKALRAQPNF